MTELIDQVSGYAQKMTWIFGIKCTVTVMYVILMMHQDASMTNIGTVDFPAPRMIPAIQCENARFPRICK